MERTKELLRAGNAQPRGFTLVELMIVVAVIGVLAALAIGGIRRYMEAARSSEAKQSIGAITRAAVQAYERGLAQGQLLAEGDESDPLTQRLCDTADPVPATVPAGAKYQPSPTPGADFQTGDVETGWTCLGFTIDQAIFYQYTYTRGDSPAAPNNPAKCSGPCFEAAARGDTNADGSLSTFAQTGHINAATKKLQTATFIYVENEFE